MRTLLSSNESGFHTWEAAMRKTDKTDKKECI